MYETCLKLELIPIITHSGTINHPQNISFVSNFAMQLIPYGSDTMKDNPKAKPEFYDYFMLLDGYGSTSSWFRNGKIPEDKLLAIIDHHDVEDDKPKANYSDIRKTGAASSIFAEYLKDGLDTLFEKEELENIATGLFLGIMKDTDNLVKRVQPLDWAMHQYLYPLRKSSVVDDVINTKNSKEFMNLKYKALLETLYEDGTSFACVGWIPEELRGVVAEVADAMMEVENTHTAYSIGILPEIIDVSIRSDKSSYEFKRIEEKFPERKGGGGKFGAWRLVLPNQFTEESYIKPCDSNKDNLQELIYSEFKKRVCDK